MDKTVCLQWGFFFILFNQPTISHVHLKAATHAPSCHHFSSVLRLIFGDAFPCNPGWWKASLTCIQIGLEGLSPIARGSAVGCPLSVRETPAEKKTAGTRRGGNTGLQSGLETVFSKRYPTPRALPTNSNRISRKICALIWN